MIRPGPIPSALVDAQGGLWIGGQCIGTMHPVEAAQPRPTALQALRARLEAQIEAAIAALDALDGDPDLEPACEDEGAACEDEGFDCDREPDVDDELSRPERTGDARRNRST